MPYLVDDSILVNIAIGLNEEEIDFERVKKVAKIAQIHNFIADLSKGYSTVIGESGIFKWWTKTKIGNCKSTL